MKIAIPTRQGFVEDHLACCESYTIFTIDEKFNIIEREIVYASEADCCAESPVARLRQTGVSVVLAGDIESSLYTRMTGFGLEVHRNFHGVVDNVVKSYLDKMISDKGELSKTTLHHHHINN